MAREWDSCVSPPPQAAVWIVGDAPPPPHAHGSAPAARRLQGPRLPDAEQPRAGVGLRPRRPYVGQGTRTAARPLRTTTAAAARPAAAGTSGRKIKPPSESRTKRTPLLELSTTAAAVAAAAAAAGSAWSDAPTATAAAAAAAACSAARVKRRLSSGTVAAAAGDTSRQQPARRQAVRRSTSPTPYICDGAATPTFGDGGSLISVFPLAAASLARNSRGRQHKPRGLQSLEHASPSNQ